MWALIALLSCSPGSYQVRLVSQTDNAATFELDGFALTCVPMVKLFEPERGSWKTVDQTIRSSNVYFLDGQWHDDRGLGCDVAACQPIEKPISIALVKYEKVGERNSPDDSFSGPVPEFRTVPLHAKLRITFEYYRDQNCQQKQEAAILVDN